MPDPAGSPCIGVCSTTYGDLICRGCYRFAHEVVEWNAYSQAQRLAIRRRLARLRAGAAARHLSPERIALLMGLAESVRLRRRDLAPPALAHEVLRRLVLKRRPLPWLASCADDQPGRQQAIEQGRALLAEIDRELLNRSRGHYERSFRAAPE